MKGRELDSDRIHFLGHGTGPSTITLYTWRSSINGEFYNNTEPEFDYAGLTAGDHMIYFKVQDTYGIWSEEVTTTLYVREIFSVIDIISPTLSLKGERINFKGHGSSGYSVVRYAWRSSYDGEFYNGTEQEFSISTLTVGFHTIYFKAMNENGVWSSEISMKITVSGIDCLFSAGYGGEYEDVVLDGDFLYALHGRGISIFDVSIPSEIERVGFVRTYDCAKEIFVDEDIAYVADSTGGIIVFNISQKRSPTKIGHWQAPGCAAYGVVADNDYAYVAAFREGLIILDISDLSNPFEISRSETQRNAQGVDVRGNYAYVADRQAGLFIFDIADKNNPIEVGSYDIDSSATKVVVEEEYAFVTTYEGVLIIDVTDKSNPVLASHYENENGLHNFELKDNYAYITEDPNLFTIVDFSDKTSPIQIGQCEIDETSYRFTIGDKFAYLTYDDTIVVVNITINSDPQVDSYHEMGLHGEVYDVSLSGNYAYAAVGDNGLIILDTSDKRNPQEVGSFDTLTNIRCIEVQDNFAYVTYEDGFAILNISDKLNPTITGLYDTSLSAEDIVIRGHFAYIGFYNYFIIINISEKNNPKDEGSYGGLTNVRKLAVIENYVYAVAGDDGLIIFDISNKRDPTIIGTYSTSSYPNDIDIVGDYAYVTCSNDVIDILDIMEKNKPKLVGQFHTKQHTPFDIMIDDNLAYIANDHTGLIILNITDRINPIQEGIYYITFKPVRFVTIEGSHAYITYSTGDLSIVTMVPTTHVKPVVTIDSISPNLPGEGRTVMFTAKCSDSDIVIRYSWRSSINGMLYTGTDNTFQTDSLTLGEHVIYLTPIFAEGLYLIIEPWSRHPLIADFLVA